MKKNLIIFLSLLVISTSTWSQKPKYKSLTDSIVTIREEQMKTSADFVTTAYTSFAAIEGSLKQSEFMTDIIKINNPTNDELGFSIGGKIKELYAKHFDKLTNNADANKVNNFIDKILNNPITEQIKNIIPAANTVISFLTSLSFGNKKIKPEQIDAFLKDINKYLAVYQELGQATETFESQISRLNTRKDASKIILEGYINDRLQGLNIDTQIKDSSLYVKTRKYTRIRVAQLIEDIEADKKYNKDTLYYSRALIQYRTAISQARYLQDEIDNLLSQYLYIHQSYINDIKTVLNKFKSLPNSKPENIDKKVLALNNKYNDWTKMLIETVNLDLLRKQVKELSKNDYL